MRRQPESLLKKQICDYITAKYRALVFMTPSQGVWDQKAGFYRRNNSRYAIRGISDLICVVNVLGFGVALFLEIKTKTGKQSEEQKKFEELICFQAGNYFIIRCTDDVDKAICKVRLEYLRRLQNTKVD